MHYLTYDRSYLEINLLRNNQRSFFLNVMPNRTCIYDGSMILITI